MGRIAGEFLVLVFSALASDQSSAKADLLCRAGALSWLCSVLVCNIIRQLYSVKFFMFLKGN